MADLSEEELQALYCWIDEIPLSRTKKNITRDFSDGVLTAEIVHHFLPQLVELHNYSPANSSPQKIENWRALNRKVFSKLNFSLPDDIIQSVSSSKPGVVEFILTTLRTKIERYLQNKARATELDSGYNYDPDDLTTSEIPTHTNYGPYDQMRHVGPANPQFQSVGFVQQVRESDMSHYDPSNLEYVTQDSQQMEGHTIKHQHRPFHSKLQPPTIYHHHHTSQPSHSSTLPPIPHHTLSHGGGMGGALGAAGAVGVAGGGGRGQPRAPNATLSKLPTIIHGRSKTYAGRPNRIGPPPSTMVPSVAAGTSGKSMDRTQQQIRLAEKEQKLYETQEYIQLLQMKVTRLEHLVQIKDMKINELQRQLAFPTRHPLHKR